MKYNSTIIKHHSDDVFVVFFILYKIDQVGQIEPRSELFWPAGPMFDIPHLYDNDINNSEHLCFWATTDANS